MLGTESVAGEAEAQQRVGERVKDWRHKAGWSRKELAQRAELADVTLWKIENGHNAKYSSLYRIANALGGSVADLVD